MEIAQIQSQDRLILFINGSLDDVTSPRLNAEISKFLPRISKLVLDLSSLSDITGAGVNVIINTADVMKSQNKLFSLRHVSKQILDQLDRAGGNSLIAIE